MITRVILKSGIAACALVAGVAPASAMAGDPEVESLREEVALLKAQLDALSKKMDEQAKTAAPPPAAAPAAEVKWKGAPEIKGEGGWSFKPRGRLLYDVAMVDAPSGIVNDGTGFSNELRRARLGVQGSIPGGFGYKFEVDFAGGDAEFTDAYLDYSHGGLTITAGQHNNFQGLEELSSSNDTSFMERSAFTDAFGFERRVGLSAQYAKGPLLVQGGVFTDNIGDLGDDGNNGIGLDGRIVLAPKVGSAQAHLGASYHWRDLGDNTISARYRQRPLVHSTDIRFIDTGSIGSAASESSFGVEGAIIAGRFHAAAEGHWLTLNRTAGNPDPTFFGGSVEAGFFLTGDKREYKEGVFKGVKVSNPVNKGGMGAFQVNARYDYLDLVDVGIIGGKQNSLQLSVIWTPVDYVRFMMNYARLNYDQAALKALGSGDYDVDVFGGRFQVAF